MFSFSDSQLTLLESAGGLRGQAALNAELPSLLVCLSPIGGPIILHCLLSLHCHLVIFKQMFSTIGWASLVVLSESHDSGHSLSLLATEVISTMLLGSLHIAGSAHNLACEYRTVLPNVLPTPSVTDGELDCRHLPTPTRQLQ